MMLLVWAFLAKNLSLASASLGSNIHLRFCVCYSHVLVWFRGHFSNIWFEVNLEVMSHFSVGIECLA